MRTLLDLSGNDQLPAGFRLQRLEVYNWGTFHNHIWRIEPCGQMALLTGENGSGKSTLVDALITLLVPNQRRNYNQSASEGKRERSELSYVRGAYGKLQSEEGYAARIQYLRDNNSYSVLLAYFRNEGLQLDVSLAQVFWLQDGLRKFYVVASVPLTISDHFSHFQTILELKKQLQRLPGVEVEEQFNHYSRRFRKLLGLRSEKAMDLFNQTVTIKEIGQLNDFVRQHMLEKTDAAEKITQLQEHYQNLMLAYGAMQKAEHQLTLLQPLAAEARKYEQAQEEIKHLRGCQAAIPTYFAGKKWQLLVETLSAVEAAYAQAQDKLRQLDDQLTTLREQDKSLAIAISNDETGRRLRELEQEIIHLQQNKQRKQDDASQYAKLARTFNLPAEPDEATFQQSKQQLSTIGKQLEKQSTQAAEQLRQAHKKEDALSEQLEEIQKEWDSLHGRTSQIPRTNLELRDRILQATAIAEADIPFIGELLQVKPGERAWQGAIERLLHNFGLRLLVPERHYRRFTNYVNQTNLRGRLVFHRVPEVDRRQPHRPDDPRALIHKLAIKPDSAYYQWIENELLERYDYTCCQDLAEFERASRAITITGLSKSGREQHEKDDRRPLDDHRYYVLGWNNADKMRAIEHEKRELEQNLKQVITATNRVKQQQKESNQKQQDYNALLQFNDYARIDWHTDAIHLTGLQAQKERLEQSSDRLQQLKFEQADIQNQIAKVAEAEQEKTKEVARYEEKISNYKRQITDSKTDVREVDEQTMIKYVPQIQTQLSEPITLNNIDKLRWNVNQHFQKAIESTQGRINIFVGNLRQMMQIYKDAYPAETADFDANVAAIAEFDQELARIERDDLPQYTQRFKSLLNEKVIEAIALLQADLYKYVEEIEENITNLNQSLRTIDYTPDTYIQLQTEASRDAEIREFKQALKECLADVGRQRTAESYEASFQKVRILIERFKDDPRWTNKVTDARQWLNFAAIERYRADDSEKHYYSDSSGKSGGQKTKLAYTILASAIAFQFGLERGQTRSKTFCFVVVDEAFSRSDENNSRYAMRLFQELGLQLLVVTPMTGIHIVEPYISACHFVWNNSEGNKSQVHTMTIEKFREERERFTQNGNDVQATIEQQP